MHYHRWQRTGDPLRFIGKYGIRKGTPRATVHPRTIDLYWAAGFLEGEGSFSWGNRSVVQVSAKQVQAEPLERLSAMFGGKVYARTVRTSAGAETRKPINAWSIHGVLARGVMMTLYKLMSPKRKAEIRRALSRG